MNKRIALFVSALVLLLMTASIGCAEQTASAVHVGDIITLGQYEQDNDLDNGPEPIDWIVITIDGNEAQLLSQYVLDAKPWNDKPSRADWKNNSTLRLWLNDEFYNSVFTDEEKAVIITKEVENYGKGYKAEPTADPVYLLSQFQADELFHSWEDGRAIATPYAMANGIYLSTKYKIGGTPTVMWWTRSPSWEGYNRAGYVAASGGVDWCGGEENGKINNKRWGVRPVICVNLDLLK